MIRKPKNEEDLKQLCVIYKKVFPVHNIFTEDEEFVINYLKPFMHNILVAEEDGRIAGGLVIFEKQYGDWKVSNFKHIGVSKEFQGKDIGSELLKTAEKLVGTGKIEIRTVEEPLGFYEKNGYEKEGELKSHYRKEESCFIMGKVLES